MEKAAHSPLNQPNKALQLTRFDAGSFPMRSVRAAELGRYVRERHR
jgi:hypothetical protein